MRLFLSFFLFLIGCGLPAQPLIDKGIFIPREIQEAYDSTSCFVGYGYPKIAVYVDIEAGDYYLKLELPVANLEKTLFPDGEKRFASLGEDMVITFNTNEDGEITGLSAEIFGNQIPARKVN